jgi:cob(I)alamin adenosyltransferase
MTTRNADAAIGERHKVRMARKKEVVDAKIREAQRDQGVLVVVTGNGKGKSSSGFGMVARALGHGMNVGVVQFIKGAIPTGEERFFRRFPDEVQFHVAGEGYTWETQDRERDIAKAEAGWAKALELLRNPDIGLIVLDELNIALKSHYLDVRRVIADLEARPPKQHVVITGRGAPPELIEAADTVSDVTVAKHSFTQGIRAQKGVEL